jgi:hypothetical protein
MKKLNLFVFAGAAVLLSACIPSVNPFYTEKDVIFDSRLIGEWKASDADKEGWRFEDAGNKKYKFIVTESNGKQGEFDAQLFKLKDNLFLDITPAKLELKDDQAEMVGIALIPGHLLVRVREIEPTLKADFFDWDWLKKYLETNPKALAHRLHDGKDGLILTATSRELQRFVLKHLDGELFSTEKSETGLIRSTNAPPTGGASK